MVRKSVEARNVEPFAGLFCYVKLENNMKERIFKIIDQRRFWFSFQLSLIFLLNIVGHIREGNTPQRIFGSRLGEAFLGFVGTILGFPSGMYFLFTDQTRGLSKGPLSLFIAYIIPAIYYSAFFFSVIYIAKHKKYWRIVAICLLIFMLLSFAGCSRVVEIPLVIT